MDRLIRDVENKLLSDEDILKIASVKYDKKYVVTHTELAQVEDLNEFMRDRQFIVILWESAKNFGHWTCIIKHHDPQFYYEFFDSYGMMPDEHLKHMDYGQKRPFLKQLLDNSGRLWLHNTCRMQKHYEHINTCGRYVGFRLLFRGNPLTRVLFLLTKNKHYDPDFWVSSLTMLI